MSKVLFGPALGIVVVLVSAPLRSQQYRVADMGVLGGDMAVPNAINNAGQVVGTATTPGTGAAHAFLYCDGSMEDLGTLGGSNSFGTSIDNTGLVVGLSETTVGLVHAFAYRNGSMQDLGALGGNYSYASGVANAWIVGQSATATGRLHAFAYNSGLMTDLGTLVNDTDSLALAVNQSGQIVGESIGSTGARAVQFGGTSPMDLGTLGGAGASALALNDFGAVVGAAATVSGARHAFLYAAGLMQDIGTLGGDFSSANGINSFDEVVGVSSTAGGAMHAFVYANGVMQDLNSLIGPAAQTLSLSNAESVSNDGRIVAQGLDSSTSQQHAYLLTPATLFQAYSASSCTQSSLYSGTSVAIPGLSYSYVPTTAPLNGELIFSATNLPAWARVDPSTGAVSGTPTAADAGTSRIITVRASNGSRSVLVAGLTLSVPQTSTRAATLSWVAPVTNIDGSPLADLAGYIIYLGTGASALNDSIVLTDPSVTSYALNNLSAGTYYFAIAAYDSSGARSALSPVVSEILE